MEWKEDEYYDFAQTLLIGRHQPWPWSGMNSGVYLANPGMSIWVFVWLARLVHATDPIALQQALSLTAVAGMALLIPFALYFIGPGENPALDEREPWFWSFALSMVNPFLVFYQRKLWPESFFPLCTMLMLMGWWRRDKKLGALTWGILGAILGQIHMSGFFFAFALVAWSYLFKSLVVPRKKICWGYWVMGSCLGAWPLIPWFIEVISTPPAGPVLSGTWGDVVQLKFWVFWITDPLGLALGNPLGLLRGNSIFTQISDFIRYPIIGGVPTYICGAAHGLALASGAVIIFRGIFVYLQHVSSKRAKLRWIFGRKVPHASLAQNSAFWGFGVLLTATQVNIRRYYLATSFPFEIFWLVKLAFAHPIHKETARRSLAVLWIAQLVISAVFVGYIHVNQGSAQGDYGEAYHVIRERHQAKFGEAWPDLKFLKLKDLEKHN